MTLLETEYVVCVSAITLMTYFVSGAKRKGYYHHSKCFSKTLALVRDTTENWTSSSHLLPCLSKKTLLLDKKFCNLIGYSKQQQTLIISGKLPNYSNNKNAILSQINNHYYVALLFGIESHDWRSLTNSKSIMAANLSNFWKDLCEEFHRVHSYKIAWM